ncbi:zinc-binding dehydrogenase [Nocardiopsis suaedae]|uniref:Zinc-binding dehydrogenase n=1 Tax=Nocardiopsis suaedae TaxID=3018444 RepID=A0ABT4TIH5_9ACTN|nr:zinc-binding dehydrogenase [Nocardiopsis suaedae]MDA2804079.1 zinc-binding dehydrogenase [Nocardiopsis suaedae]
MRAVVIERFGSPDGVAVVDLPDPAPGPGQVVVDVEAVGLGGVDALILGGGLSAAYGFAEGHVPGGEVAGTVAAVGEGGDASLVGRRVWAPTGTGGGCAERVSAPAEEAVPLPPGLSGAGAVTLGGPGAVARFGLARAGLAPGASVLVRGASGSIGIAAVQLAVRAGAEAVAVTASSPERGDRLRGLGATHVLDRAGGGAGPQGFDAVLDVAAGPDLPGFLGRLNPNGILVAVGIMAGMPPADFGAVLLEGFRRSLTFATLSTDTVPVAERNRVRAAQFADAARGGLRTVVHEVMALDRAASAFRRMADGEVFGRIVLEP